MNYVILVGRVGDQPKIIKTNKLVAKFSLATNEYYKNKDGENITETEWHNIVFFQSVEFISKAVNKGDLVFVQGKIVTRTWKDQKGDPHWATEIIGMQIELLKSNTKKEEEPVF